MSDKFKQNIKIALPAAFATIIILIIQGFGFQPTEVIEASQQYSILKILPYLLVIALSIIGINVFVVLLLGVIAAGVLGLAYADFTIIEFTTLAYTGFTSMTEIFLLSLLTGGLAALVEKHGGIQFILDKIKSLIKNKATAL